MSRWVTYYYDLISDHVSALAVHSDKQSALKYFNKNHDRYFSVNSGFKADKLPASYGYPTRKFVGCSAAAFKKTFGVSIDAALKLAEKG